MPKKRNPKTPAILADALLTKYLSADDLYWLVLDEVHTDDIERLKAVVKKAAGPPSNIHPAKDIDAEAEREVAFMIGLELGRRIGGVR